MGIFCHSSIILKEKLSFTYMSYSYEIPHKFVETKLAVQLFQVPLVRRFVLAYTIFLPDQLYPNSIIVVYYLLFTFSDLHQHILTPEYFNS